MVRQKLDIRALLGQQGSGELKINLTKIIAETKINPFFIFQVSNSLNYFYN